ncbi:MAG: hypothetical protein ABJA37_15595, partial [Ferruginibacter sp.]
GGGGVNATSSISVDGIGGVGGSGGCGATTLTGGGGGGGGATACFVCAFAYMPAIVKHAAHTKIFLFIYLVFLLDAAYGVIHKFSKIKMQA